MSTIKKCTTSGLVVLVALALFGASQSHPTWTDPYTPTRLEWLALQCNMHHRHRYEMVHTTFLAVPPNKIEAIVKFSEKAKSSDAQLRKEVALAATDYVRDTAKAMGWVEPIDVHATEIFH